jgi:hypothetical protein
MCSALLLHRPPQAEGKTSVIIGSPWRLLAGKAVVATCGSLRWALFGIREGRWWWLSQVVPMVDINSISRGHACGYRAPTYMCGPIDTSFSTETSSTSILI